MKVLLVIAGSRSLAKVEGGEAWARKILEERIVQSVTDALPDQAFLLSGGADGPDTWSAELGKHHGLEVVTYRPDGRRIASSGRETRWGDRGSPLIRNFAMASAAATAKEEGWRIDVLALVDPRSRKHGTWHMVGACKKVGLVAECFVFQENAP